MAVNLESLKTIDHDAWQETVQPLPNSLLDFVPFEIRQLGLKVACGQRLTQREEAKLKEFRSRDGLFHLLMASRMQKRRFKR